MTLAEPNIVVHSLEYHKRYLGHEVKTPSFKAYTGKATLFLNFNYIKIIPLAILRLCCCLQRLND